MFRLTRLRRLRRVLDLPRLLACALAAPASAAEPEWLKLQAPSFGVISQLDEKETLAWAVEFEQFIGALHALYSADQVALPPLTIVLFRQPRDFAPYRLRTDSGQARIAGFFGNTGDWSVIGMPGSGRDDATRQTIYHEAVHWFATASDTPQPLWFAEGLAEVLSTFEVVDGKGRWGAGDRRQRRLPLLRRPHADGGPAARVAGRRAARRRARQVLPSSLGVRSLPDVRQRRRRRGQAGRFPPRAAGDGPRHGGRHGVRQVVRRAHERSAPLSRARPLRLRGDRAARSKRRDDASRPHRKPTSRSRSAAWRRSAETSISRAATPTA